MRITKIKYEHKLPVNENEVKTAGATALVMEGEDPKEGFKVLKKFIEDQLEIEVVAKKEEKKEEVQKPLPLKVVEPVKEVATTKEEKVVEKKKEEPKVEEKQEVKPTTEVVEEKKVTKKKAKKVTKKAPAKKKEKFVLYDRMVDSHKKELGIYLKETLPGWNKDEALSAKAVKLSAEMTGVTPLYNKDGDVTDEFKVTVNEGMK